MPAVAHLQENQPSLEAHKVWLAWYLIGKSLRQAICNMLCIGAPLVPHMIKELLGQLH